MGAKQVFRTALTDVIFNAQTWWEAPGTIRYENNAVYKWVGFTGANAVAAGGVVCYVAFGSDGTLTLVDNANTNLGAGVAMAAVAAGSKTSSAIVYAQGWVQIRGIATLASAIGGSSPAIGNPVTTNGASAGAVALKSTTAATLALQMEVGYVYDATAKALACNFPF